MCHGNEQVQREIADLQAQDMAPNEELTKLGLEAELEMGSSNAADAAAVDRARVKIRNVPRK